MEEQKRLPGEGKRNAFMGKAKETPSWGEAQCSHRVCMCHCLLQLHCHGEIYHKLSFKPKLHLHQEETVALGV